MEKLNLTFYDLIDNIAEELETLTGDEVSKIYNDICKIKVEYIKDGLWEEI